jgi:hypothetical protein
MPVDADGREQFWRELPERFRSIEAQHPGRVTADDKAQAITAIARRIPRLIPEEWAPRCRSSRIAESAEPEGA